MSKQIKLKEKIVSAITGKKVHGFYAPIASNNRLYVDKKQQTRFYRVGLNEDGYGSYSCTHTRKILRMLVDLDGVEYDVMVPVENTHQPSNSSHSDYIYSYAQCDDGAVIANPEGLSIEYSLQSNNSKIPLSQYLEAVGFVDGYVHFTQGRAKILNVTEFYGCYYLRGLLVKDILKPIYQIQGENVPCTGSIKNYVFKDGEALMFNDHGEDYLPVLEYTLPEFRAENIEVEYDYIQLEMVE